jgi:hypothetical protein
MEKLQKALNERLEKAKYIKKRRVGNKWVYDYGSKKGMTSAEAQKEIMKDDTGKKPVVPAGRGHSGIQSALKQRTEIKIPNNTSSSFKYHAKFASVNEIKYRIRENKYTKKQEMVYTGSAKDFFEQKKRTGFVQITKPTGFDKNTRGKTNIEISILTGDISKTGTPISTTVLYEVN